MASKMLPCSRRAFLLLAVLTIVLAPALLAQTAGTSALTGTVTDPSGAAVPNVTVTLTSNDTNQARTAVTGGDGVYRFNLLPPGSYRARFAANGFKTSDVSAVNLTVTESVSLDRKLEVGAQSEQVTVIASAETLQTATSSLGTTVGAGQVTAIPLANRNYTQILGLAAGASAPPNNATAFGQGHAGYQRQRRRPGAEQLPDGRRGHQQYRQRRELPTTAAAASMPESASRARTRFRSSRSRPPPSTPAMAATPART